MTVLQSSAASVAQAFCHSRRGGEAGACAGKGVPVGSLGKAAAACAPLPASGCQALDMACRGRASVCRPLAPPSSPCAHVCHLLLPPCPPNLVCRCRAGPLHPARAPPLAPPLAPPPAPARRRALRPLPAVLAVAAGQPRARVQGRALAAGARVGRALVGPLALAAAAPAVPWVAELGDQLAG